MIGLHASWALVFFEAGLILHTVPDKVEPRGSFVSLPRFAAIIEFQSSPYCIASVFTTVNVCKVVHYVVLLTYAKFNNSDLTIRQRRRQRQREKSGSSRATSCWRSRQNWDYEFYEQERWRRPLMSTKVFSKLCLSFVTPFSWLMLPVWLKLKNSCYSTIYTSLKIRINPTRTTSALTSTRWQMMNVKLSLDFTRMTSTTWQMYWLYQIESFATMV